MNLDSTENFKYLCCNDRLVCYLPTTPSYSTVDSYIWSCCIIRIKHTSLIIVADVLAPNTYPSSTLLTTTLLLTASLHLCLVFSSHVDLTHYSDHLYLELPSTEYHKTLSPTYIYLTQAPTQSPLPICTVTLTASLNLFHRLSPHLRIKHTTVTSSQH